MMYHPKTHMELFYIFHWLILRLRACFTIKNVQSDIKVKLSRFSEKNVFHVAPVTYMKKDFKMFAYFRIKSFYVSDLHKRHFCMGLVYLPNQTRLIFLFGFYFVFE